MSDKCNLIKRKPGVWYCPTCKRECKSTPGMKPTRYCFKPLTEDQIRARNEQHRINAEQKAKDEEEAIEIGEQLGWTAADAKKWATALVGWRRAGYPKRSKAEIEQCVAICNQCEFYSQDEQRCRICRCNVRSNGLAIFNKAALATQDCDEHKWPKNEFTKDMGHRRKLEIRPEVDGESP